MDYIIRTDHFKESELRAFEFEPPTSSCIGHSLLAGVISLPMGFVFALFGPTTSILGAPKHIQEGTFAQQNIYMMRETMKRAWSLGKSFFALSIFFTGTECFIEKTTAKTTPYGAIAGGIFTGALIAFKGGPRAMLFSAAGIGAMSIGIEAALGKFGHRPSEIFAMFE